MEYHPGDAFDLFCPNRAVEVEEMLRRLGLWEKRSHQVCISLKTDTKKRGTTLIDINSFDYCIQTTSRVTKNTIIIIVTNLLMSCHAAPYFPWGYNYLMFLLSSN